MILSSFLHPWISRVRHVIRDPGYTIDYKEWRNQLILNRVNLYAWLTLLLTLLFLPLYLYYFLVLERPETILSPIDRTPLPLEAIGEIWAAHWHETYALIILVILLILFIRVQSGQWAKKFPSLIFLIFSLLLSVAPQIVSLLWGVLTEPYWNSYFLAQAMFVPVQWQLHLISQVSAIALHFSLGFIATSAGWIRERSLTSYTIYDPVNVVYVFQAIFVCGLCNIGVYLYDRLQSSEFEAKRQLRLLLHALAHDLKTPITGTAIVLQNFLAQKDKTDDQAKDMIMIPVEKLGKLINSHQRQISLIDAILKIHQHESHAFSLQCQSVDFQRLCADVIADLQEHFQDHHVEVVNQVRPDLPSVWGDPTQLWRVLTNLMTNAIQHNPEGIRLILDATVIDASVGQNEALSVPTHSPPVPRLRCSVQDNGAGIPLEQQHTLFDLYWRRPQNPYAPGLGLGLYFCRQIIEAHGGEIGVSNAQGQGSIFWFTVPLAPQTSPARRATTAA